MRRADRLFQVIQALRRRPAAVLLTIEHPSQEIFAYNVTQEAAFWPVPVILVAPKDEARLAAAEAAGTPVGLFHCTTHACSAVSGSTDLEVAELRGAS